MTPSMTAVLVALGLTLTVSPAPLLTEPGSEVTAARTAPTAPTVRTVGTADQLALSRSIASPAEDRGLWPLQPDPEVVAGFAPGGQDWLAGHRGVDLLATPGQPVRSALAGVVTFAGTIAGRGVVVVVHGDLRTTYEPVQAGVSRGDQVGAGAVIGTVQSARGHCPPRTCLHWGLLAEEDYRDPLSLLGRGPVRLLPP